MTEDIKPTVLEAVMAVCGIRGYIVIGSESNVLGATYNCFEFDGETIEQPFVVLKRTDTADLIEQCRMVDSMMGLKFDLTEMLETFEGYTLYQAFTD